jgi:hypothetical protein
MQIAGLKFIIWMYKHEWLFKHLSIILWGVAASLALVFNNPTSGIISISVLVFIALYFANKTMKL